MKLSTDMERRSYGIRARARWTDPTTKRRVTRSDIVPDEAAAHTFFDQLRNSSTKGMDGSMTLLEFVTSIGDRWARGLDLHRRDLRIRTETPGAARARTPARHADHRRHHRPHHRRVGAAPRRLDHQEHHRTAGPRAR